VIDRLAGFYAGRIDRMLASGGIIIGIAFISILQFVAPNYTSIGGMLSLACAAYLLLTRRREVVWETGVTLVSNPRLYLVLNILFLVLLSYSITVLYYSSDSRPLGYFVSTALMAAILALEIITIPEDKKGRSTLILVKILIIALSLRWSLFYIYPDSYLGTDPWRNAEVYNRIIQTGHLLREIGGYYYMPIHHYMVTTSVQLTGISVRTVMILTIGLVEVLSLIFVFLFARHLFNAKVGLLSALVLGINNLHITWGWWLVAQTAGIAFLPMILFLISRARMQDSFWFKVIYILMLFVLLMTHAVSTFVTLVILLLSYLGSVIYGLYNKTELSNVSGNFAILFVVASIGYWIYISHFFDSFVLMLMGIGPGITQPVPYATTITEISPLWMEINRFGNNLYYVMAFIGVLYLLNPRNVNVSRFNLAFCGICLTGIIFLGFFLVKIEVFICRWFIFTDILLAVPVALGLIVLTGIAVRRWKKLSISAIITFVLAFLMISNTSASFDSPLYPDSLKDKSGLTESELHAADTLKSIYSDTLIMDGMHALAYTGTPEIQVEKYFLYKESVLMNIQGEGLFVLRQYIVDKLFVTPQNDGINNSGSKRDAYLELQQNGYNQVYDAGTVAAYHR